MSVVAARICGPVIEIAADSIILKGSLKRTPNFSKLRQFPDITIGGVGVAEELSIFFEFAEEHTPESATVKGIRKYMADFLEYAAEYIAEPVVENSYLIIFKGKLFEVDNMFIQEIQDYTSIGEGEHYALAAMHLGESAERAIKTSCELCCLTSEPIVYYIIER